jgi:hypothetical protein
MASVPPKKDLSGLKALEPELEAAASFHHQASAELATTLVGMCPILDTVTFISNTAVSEHQDQVLSHFPSSLKSQSIVKIFNLAGSRLLASVSLPNPNLIYFSIGIKNDRLEHASFR